MSSDADGPPPGRVMRPADIPIYGTPRDLQSINAKPQEVGMLQEGIASVRRTLQATLVGPLKEFNAEASRIYETGKAHSGAAIEELREPENAPLRAAAVASGGLLGYAIGAFRGRIIKKIFYGTLGGGLVAAIVYPEETKGFANDVIEQGKEIRQIAYNFVNGVGPDSPAPLPASVGKGDQSSAEKPSNDLSNPADKDLYSTRGSS